MTVQGNVAAARIDDSRSPQFDSVILRGISPCITCQGIRAATHDNVAAIGADVGIGVQTDRTITVSVTIAVERDIEASRCAAACIYGYIRAAFNADVVIGL